MAETQPPFERRHPESVDIWDNPFVFPVTMLTDVRDRLQATTITDLRSFIAVREQLGVSNDLTRQVYDAGLTQWQVEKGLFSALEAQLYHKAGILYGVQLIEDFYFQKTGQQFRPVDLRAYDTARNVVQGSYADANPRCHRLHVESGREEMYLGSSRLNVLSALMHERIRDQLGSREIKPDVAHDAFYTGLIDGALFSFTYGRVADGEVPRRFWLPYEYALTRRNLKGYSVIATQYGGIETGEVDESRIYRFGHDLPEDEVLRSIDAEYEPIVDFTISVPGATFLLHAKKFVKRVAWGRYKVGHCAYWATPIAGQPFPWEVPFIKANADKRMREDLEWTATTYEMWTDDTQIPDEPGYRECAREGAVSALGLTLGRLINSHLKDQIVVSRVGASPGGFTSIVGRV